MTWYSEVKKVSGTGDAANGSADQTIISAPGARKQIYLQKGFISVTVIATGGGGLASLEDGAGGTKILSVDGDAVCAYPFDFGEPGYPLTANTLLNLTVDGAVTTQATAVVTATGIVI